MVVLSIHHEVLIVQFHFEPVTDLQFVDPSALRTNLHSPKMTKLVPQIKGQEKAIERTLSKVVSNRYFIQHVTFGAILQLNFIRMLENGYVLVKLYKSFCGMYLLFCAISRYVLFKSTILVLVKVNKDTMFSYCHMINIANPSRTFLVFSMTQIGIQSIPVSKNVPTGGFIIL